MADAAILVTTHELADFIVGTHIAVLPEEVRQESPRAFLNGVGCALSGYRHEAVAVALAVAEELSEPPWR